MRTLFERSVLAGIGLLSMTHEKAQKIVDELIRRGEVQKDEAKYWVESLVQRGEDERQSLRKLIHDEVKSTLDEFGLATKQDLQDLTNGIDALSKQGKA
jgi:polyhydroxyalkanoate synthesis regulator phasin